MTDGSQYFILLIISDGVITDMAQTKESIVNVRLLYFMCFLSRAAQRSGMLVKVLLTLANKQELVGQQPVPCCPHNVHGVL